MNTDDNTTNAESSQSNEEDQADDSGGSQTRSTARRARQPRVPRSRRNHQTTNTAQDGELKAQLRAARDNDNTNTTVNLNESITIPDDSSTAGVHVGDDFNVENLVSVPPTTTPRRMLSGASQFSETTGPRLAREPSIRSMYTDGRRYSATSGKEQPTPLANGQRVGAVEVQERAFGYLPAWHRPPSPNNHMAAHVVSEEIGIDVGHDVGLDLGQPFEAVVSEEFSLSEPTGPMHPVSFGNISIDSNSMDVSIVLDDPLVEDTLDKASIVPKALCVFAVVVAIIGSVIMGLFLKVEENAAAQDVQSRPITTTTTAPTPVPIQECSNFRDIDPLLQNMNVDTLDQYNLLLESVVQKLLPNHTSPENVYEDLCSAHHRALVWLTNDSLSKDSFEVAENRYLLAFLFLSWKGDTWPEQNLWLSDTTECGWLGISCNESGQIVALDWSIPKNITELSVIIPSEIGLLSDLTYLNLKHHFMGSVPSTIGKLTNLRTLDLSQNFQLSGAFPYGSIDRLNKLRALTLSDLGKMIAFPPPSINKLSSLEYLDVARTAPSNQQLPSEIGDLVNLAVLSTRQTDSNGEIPIEVFSLTNLEYLNLGNNDFHGELVSEIGLLQKLNMLILDSNALSGQIPTEIGGLSLLETLTVEQNIFTGALPHEIGNCTNLEYLSLSRTDIDEDLPAELYTLSNLTSLHLAELLLSGSIPLDLFTLSNLEIIDLAETPFNGNATIDLFGMASLECFDISDTGVAGTLIGGNECRMDFASDATLSECDSLQVDTCTCCSDCGGIGFKCQEDLLLFEEIPQALKDRFLL